MLKLHSLEINGFKTFVDPVELSISSGITAIVGPNGCGKSNISDSLTWVLGEQSAKSLRSTTMQDVIFNGAATRKPLGAAEVTLNLVTDPSFPRSENGKISIGRRVFRSGESNYRLNDKNVRLKEIKDLLMDTGLGIRAYSVIEQGKIGMILSGKPHERRKLLEEAAGITRYKARKRIAEVKLKEATANLLRLEDIISEVRRALRSLKRQANAARRYQEKEREYRTLLDLVLKGRWFLQANRLEELSASLAELTDKDAGIVAGLHRDQAELTQGRELLDQLARRLGERHQDLADIAATIEGRQEFIKGSKQRLDEIGERRNRGGDQAKSLHRQIEEMGSSLGDLDQRTVQLVAEHAEAERAVAEDDAQIAAAQRQVEQAEARLNNFRQELMRSVARVNQLRSEAQRQQVEIEKKVYRQRYLNDEQARLDQQVGEATATLQRIDDKLLLSNGVLEERQEKRAKLTENLDALLRREAELTEERRDLETRLAGLRQRQQILTELAEEHDKSRRKLIERLREIGIDDPRFLANELRSPAGWEDGIDHFLGELSDAILLEDDQDILVMAQRLSQLNGSGIFLRPIANAKAIAEATEIEDEALAYSLAEALDLPDELAHALPPAYLVEQAEDAQRLASAHPGIAFISRDRLWAQGGTVRVQSEQAAPGVLARSSELESISEEIPTSEARLEQVRSMLQNLVGERTRHATEINRNDEAIAELRREMAVAQARRQDAEARSQKFTDQLKVVTDEQNELSEELKNASTTNQDHKEQLTGAEANHQQLNEGFEQAQQEVESAKEQRETLRTAGAGRRGRLELLRERLDSQNQEVVRVRKQVEDNHQRIQAWRQEEDVLERRQRELEINIEQAEDQLQIALERKTSAQEAVLAEQERLDEKRETVRGLEGRVEGQRKEREDLRTGIEKLRIDQASQRQDAEHLAVTYREEFKMYLPGTAPPKPEEDPETSAGSEPAPNGEAVVERATAEEIGVPGENADANAESVDVESTAMVLTEDGEPVAAEDGEEAPESLEDYEELTEVPPMQPGRLAELEGDLSRCKTALERLGPVNVLAAEEYDEQQERYTFLTTQRDDVRQSVDSLTQTIQEINQASSERFRETFHTVNKTFGEMFSRLFRGGEAFMNLLDEDDVLESGIEIIARPPGKRNQNIMLLSGGEKALTAIALLFALFQSKPSPFCILDEVDAPLDDVNVLRFVETLKEMAKDTQFLIITHNKLTMEAASTLYGVTMEERGISKLVSVQLEEVHPLPEAATA